MSEKIQPQHLSRKAMLYVRQSSAFQVSHNLESGKLQYAMQVRLREMGFAEIEVIDEDLGRSAAGTVTRSGDFGRRYPFKDAGTLIDDFFDEIERVLTERGISIEVLADDDGVES